MKKIISLLLSAQTLLLITTASLLFSSIFVIGFQKKIRTTANNITVETICMPKSMAKSKVKFKKRKLMWSN